MVSAVFFLSEFCLLQGTIITFTYDTKIPKEESSIHKGKVIKIAFNWNGTRMVTADDAGLIAIWKGMSCLCSYQREGAITHCLFADLVMEDPQQKQKSKMNNLLFFGGTAGIVWLGDDANHCTELCKIVGTIKSLLFYERDNSIILITNTLLLVTFKITTGQKSSPDKRVKLSIAGDPEKLTSL